MSNDTATAVNTSDPRSGDELATHREKYDELAARVSWHWRQASRWSNAGISLKAQYHSRRMADLARELSDVGQAMRAAERAMCKGWY